MRKSREFEFGRTGEDIVRKWFLEQGFAVVPVHMIEDGGAPMLLSWIKDEILPDFQVWGQDKRLRWVEVKTKERAVLFQKWNRWVTGCNKRNYLAYKSVQERTGSECWMAFIHKEQRELALGKLNEIEKSVQFVTHPSYGSEPMANFSLDRFDRYDLSDAEVGRLVASGLIPNVIHPWQPVGTKAPKTWQGFLFCI